MAEPGWLKTISNHAVISRDELLEWLGVSVKDLRVLLDEQGMPAPRFGPMRAVKKTRSITSTCRWRVGDIRAWIEGSARLRDELETEIAAERTFRTRELRASGFDPMRRPPDKH